MTNHQRPVRGRSREAVAEAIGSCDCRCEAHPDLEVVHHDAMGLPPASPGLPRPTHSHQPSGPDGMVLFCSGKLTEPCANCGGSGVEYDDPSDWPEGYGDTPKAWTCKPCNGSGRMPA